MGYHQKTKKKKEEEEEERRKKKKKKKGHYVFKELSCPKTKTVFGPGLKNQDGFQPWPTNLLLNLLPNFALVSDFLRFFSIFQKFPPGAMRVFSHSLKVFS